MSNEKTPEGMISVDQFAQKKGITTEKAISMIKEGFYSGKIVGEQWYANTDELGSEKNSSSSKDTSTYKSNYGTARTMASFISVCGWFVVVTGVIVAFVLASSGYRFNFLAMLPGLGAAISGLFMVAAGQVTRATVDNADHTREIMTLLKEKA